MTRQLVVAGLIAILLSCGNDKKVPRDILPAEKMGTLLFEIGMAEARLENYVFRDSTMNRDSALQTELDKVLQVHRLTQESFRKSYDYYKERPAQLKEILDTVYARSQRSQEKLYGKRPPGRKRLQADTSQKE